MATDVVMPQMGESVAEGTVVRWIKKIGDTVERDEPLFEISTDKVDAEIPSPVAGVLSEIRVQEGETVPVNSVVAVIGAAGDVKTAPKAAVPEQAVSPAAAPAPTTPPVAAQPAAAPAAAGPPVAAPVPTEPPIAAQPAAVPVPTGPPVAAQPATPAATAQATESAPAATTAEDRLHQRSSPLVRRIAKEHNVDISHLHGTGISGRVTKDDILGYLGSDRSELARAPRPPVAPAQAAPAAASADRVEKISVMRKKIAEHMVASRRTSAHVHSVFEVNFSRVAQIREKKKAEYQSAGGKLTYLSFILKAVADALRKIPVVNASIDGDQIVYHKDVNVGIAVALDWGLIVPVIKKADEKSLLELSHAVADLAGRARSKQLKPDDVAGGTFTITNPGVFGALFGMPIINQPQVAILGVGAVEKRPVVIDDAIGIRPMAYLTLGYDHRLIDGAVADQFLSAVKTAIETWDPSAA